MTRDEILAKLDKIVSKEPSKWLEHAQYYEDNEKWLKRSGYVALAILTALDDQGISQKALADRMGISPQQVNKWVKGSENFTFETIAKLEEALNIELMSVVGEDWNMAKKKKVVVKKEIVPDNPEYNTVSTAIKESILVQEPEVHLKKGRKKV
jgi:ribosome-binding protein aMBF1 (putative translation factor)